ncbi:uncharacterized protein MELLADRAFT_114442 [Melampsora larici-populina 98AG31]|uniref:Uncharacterized protein n=1 Tax=Melampsora larici-populina (strain 98AG31 / pathotype 3-4-7) TaxID=747676 RepID=F4SDH6_MELLP|nr:uncharacterized protein MELLADRAFT_114442 [Melampsora larici-populina 98AG31]EGF97300.1 hypothetical protein MELLADRAFT_114442 [Melampsora larici-populina 98AG31]
MKTSNVNLSTISTIVKSNSTRSDIDQDRTSTSTSQLPKDSETPADQTETSQTQRSPIVKNQTNKSQPLQATHINQQVKDPTCSPTRSDSSSTSHLVEELLIINSLTPRKRKEEASSLTHQYQQPSEDENHANEHLPDLEQEPTSSTIILTPVLRPTPAEECSSDACDVPSKHKPHQVIDSKSFNHSVHIAKSSQLDLPLPNNREQPVLCTVDTNEPSLGPSAAKSRKRKLPQIYSYTNSQLNPDESGTTAAAVTTNSVSTTLAPNLTSGSLLESTDPATNSGLANESSELLVKTAHKSRRLQKPNVSRQSITQFHLT